MHYGYDNAGRLIGEQRQSRQTLAAGGSTDKTAHTVWTYDKANNRTTQNLSNYDGLGTDAPSVLTSTHATQYNYNSNDWLLSQTSEYTTSSTTNTYTTNYEYNGNGSQSAVTSNVGTPDQKRTPYFYDFEEKLIGIGNPADTTKHAYAYDADGNRVTETNYANGTPTTKHYLIDPNVSYAQVVEEFDSANQLLAHHDWDDAELLRSAVADNEGNAHITLPLADGHNSTRQLMDATGSIGGILGYDAWGNAQESIGLSTAYRYNSQRLDASGLYYLRARQYAPWTGRFLSHDSVLGDMNNPITQHRYLYAGSDPVNGIDPSGLEFSMVGLGVSSSMAESLRTVSSAVYERIYRRTSDTLMYGAEFATRDMVFDALIDAVPAFVIFDYIDPEALLDIGQDLYTAYTENSLEAEFEDQIQLAASGQLKGLEVIERYMSEAEEVATRGVNGLVIRPGHESRPKWVSVQAVRDEQIGKGLNRNNTHKVQFYVEKGTIEWLRKFEIKPSNEPGSFAIPAGKLEEFNQRVVKVTSLRIKNLGRHRKTGGRRRR